MHLHKKSKDKEYIRTNTSSTDCHRICYSQAPHLFIVLFFAFKLVGVLKRINKKKLHNWLTQESLSMSKFCSFSKNLLWLDMLLRCFVFANQGENWTVIETLFQFAAVFFPNRWMSLETVFNTIIKTLNWNVLFEMLFCDYTRRPIFARRCNCHKNGVLFKK